MSKKDMDRRKKFILELMGDPIYQPMRLREISSLLRLSKEEKRELYDVLDELCEEGKVSVDRKGRYEKVKGKWKKKKDDRYYDDRREEYGSEYGRKKKDKNKKDKNKKEQPEGIQAEGTFIGHPKGFGFVEIEGQDEDIFIPESDTGTAMHQDKVRIIIRNDKKEGKRQEGVVVKVLERGMPEIVGTYQLNRDFGFVISDNPKFSKDIFIPRKEAAGIKNGDKVIVVITDYGSGGQYFWKIALPLLIPSIKSAAILSMVGSLKYFDLIYVMTGGGPGTATELMATYMYKESFKNFNMGYGSAIAGGMFILITMVSMITMKLINGKQED